MTTETTTPPAVAPTAPPAATPTTPATPAVAWLPSDVDAEIVGHVQNKAWASPADAVKSHRELEKLFGADRAGRTLTIPTAADAPEWAQVWTKLGKPQGPDGYAIKAPEGADPTFAKAASEAFHAANLTTAQAQQLATWWQGVVQADQQQQEAARAEALRADHESLAKDWGTGPDAAARREVARRAMQHLGLDEKAVDALEKAAGFSGTMKALAKVGDLLQERGIEGFTSVGSFGMTPEGAKARRAQLMADKDWRTRAMNPASAEWAEMQKLDRVIAGVPA